MFKIEDLKCTKEKLQKDVEKLKISTLEIVKKTQVDIIQRFEDQVTLLNTGKNILKSVKTHFRLEIIGRIGVTGKG